MKNRSRCMGFVNKLNSIWCVYQWVYVVISLLDYTCISSNINILKFGELDLWRLSLSQVKAIFQEKESFVTHFFLLTSFKKDMSSSRCSWFHRVYFLPAHMVTIQSHSRTSFSGIPASFIFCSYMKLVSHSVRHAGYIHERKYNFLQWIYTHFLLDL